MNEKVTANKLVKAMGVNGALHYAKTKVMHFTKFASIANEAQAKQWATIAELIEMGK